MEREQRINKLTVIAEENEVQDPQVIGDAPDCPEKSLTEVLDRFQDVLSDIPGQTDISPFSKNNGEGAGEM